MTGAGAKWRPTATLVAATATLMMAAAIGCKGKPVLLPGEAPAVLPSLAIRLPGDPEANPSVPLEPESKYGPFLFRMPTGWRATLGIDHLLLTAPPVEVPKEHRDDGPGGVLTVKLTRGGVRKDDTDDWFEPAVRNSLAGPERILKLNPVIAGRTPSGLRVFRQMSAVQATEGALNFRGFVGTATPGRGELAIVNSDRAWLYDIHRPALDGLFGSFGFRPPPD